MNLLYDVKKEGIPYHQDTFCIKLKYWKKKLIAHIRLD